MQLKREILKMLRSKKSMSRLSRQRRCKLKRKERKLDRLRISGLIRKRAREAGRRKSPSRSPKWNNKSSPSRKKRNRRKKRLL